MLYDYFEPYFIQCNVMYILIETHCDIKEVILNYIIIIFAPCGPSKSSQHD